MRFTSVYYSLEESVCNPQDAIWTEKGQSEKYVPNADERRYSVIYYAYWCALDIIMMRNSGAQRLKPKIIILALKFKILRTEYWRNKEPLDWSYQFETKIWHTVRHCFWWEPMPECSAQSISQGPSFKDVIDLWCAVPGSLTVPLDRCSEWSLGWKADSTLDTRFLYLKAGST